MMAESAALAEFQKHHEAIYEALHRQFAEFNAGLNLEQQTYFDGKLWHLAAQLYANGIKEWPPHVREIPDLAHRT